MTDWVQDARHSLRQLMRRPIFTATAVLTLAIGMGVNAVAFSVVNGILFKGLCAERDSRQRPHPDHAWWRRKRLRTRSPSTSDSARRRKDALDIAAEGRSSLAWKHDAATDTAWVLYVSRQYFSLVSPPVIAGRLQVQRDRRHDERW